MTRDIDPAATAAVTPLDPVHEPLPLALAAALPDAETATTGRRATVAARRRIRHIGFYPPLPAPAARTAAHPRVVIHVPGGTAGPATVAGPGFHRSIDVGDFTVVERVFVPHDLACVILEWEPVTTLTDSVLRLDATVRLHARGHPPTEVRWRESPGTATIEAADGTTVCLLSHENARFVRASSPSSGSSLRTPAARYSIEIPLGPAPVRLIVAAESAEGDDIASTLRAARLATDRLRARLATLRARDRDRLRLHSTDDEADARLRHALHRVDAVPVFNPADLVLAALAGGEFTVARELLLELRRSADPARAAGDETGAANAVLGGPDRSAGRRERASHASGIASVLDRLGIAFYGWTGDRAFLDGGNPDPQTVPATPLDPPAGSPVDGAHDAIRHTVTGPVLDLVGSKLAVTPDAGRGRLRLQPALHDLWPSFEVDNLAAGDARFRIRVSTTGSAGPPARATAESARRIEIEVEQTDGAVPFRLILEPVIAANHLVAALVDGQPAVLVARPSGSHIQIPVQLVLDHLRHLVLDVI